MVLELALSAYKTLPKGSFSHPTTSSTQTLLLSVNRYNLAHPPSKMMFKVASIAMITLTAVFLSAGQVNAAALIADNAGRNYDHMPEIYTHFDCPSGCVQRF